MGRKRIYCETNAVTPLLRQLQREGCIELIHFPYDPNSRSRKIARSALPSAARWDDCNLTWAEASGIEWRELVGSEKLDAIERVIGSGHRRDSLHVDSALKSGCICFVTHDRDILDHAEALEALVGFPFLNPERDAGRIEQMCRAD